MTSVVAGGMAPPPVEVKVPGEGEAIDVETQLIEAELVLRQ